MPDQVEMLLLALQQPDGPLLLRKLSEKDPFVLNAVTVLTLGLRAAKIGLNLPRQLVQVPAAQAHHQSKLAQDSEAQASRPSKVRAWRRGCTRPSPAANRCGYAFRMAQKAAKQKAAAAKAGTEREDKRTKALAKNPDANMPTAAAVRPFAARSFRRRTHRSLATTDTSASDTAHAVTVPSRAAGSGRWPRVVLAAVLVMASLDALTRVLTPLLDPSPHHLLPHRCTHHRRPKHWLPTTLFGT